MENQIKNLIAKEIQRASTLFRPIHSAHEGYGIIKEEIEEIKDEIEPLKNSFDRFWDHIKNNNPEGYYFELNHMYKFAFNAIKEAIQICAMIKRFENDLGGNENE